MRRKAQLLDSLLLLTTNMLQCDTCCITETMKTVVRCCFDKNYTLTQTCGYTRRMDPDRLGLFGLKREEFFALDKKNSTSRNIQTL